MNSEEAAFVRKALEDVEKSEKISRVKNIVVTILAIAAAVWAAFQPTGPGRPGTYTVIIVIGAMLGACTAKIKALIDKNTLSILRAIADLHRVLSGNAKQFVAILTLAMIGASALLGQADSASAKWVGRWALDVEKSTFEAPLLPGGPSPLTVVSQMLRIDQGERNIRLSGETVYSDNSGTHSAQDETSLSLDSTPTFRGPISLSFRRITDSSFEIVSQASIRERNLREVSHFAISSDGGTLIETKTQTEREGGADKNTPRVIRSSVSVLVFIRKPAQN